MFDALTHWNHLGSLLIALLIDAAVGDPHWLYRRLPHPVVWIGRVIARADEQLNRASDTPSRRKIMGIAATAALLLGSLVIGALLQAMLLKLPGGGLWLAIAISSLIAQNSLYDHVAAVASGLETSGAEGGRIAVSRIVGRDPEALDRAGISRAAIESLAENFSDGIVAPVFWAALLGLPGILAYKAINTADSMIGHRTPRHQQFGWAAARVDDLLNLIPARLSGLLLAAATLFVPGANPSKALSAMWRDARRHRSPNAGWPEAAMAGALGLALNGPRRYHNQLVMDAWMGSGGTPYASANDIRRALLLYVIACLIQGVILMAAIWFSH
ncbi:adenosylcobinamide-phosphate synthase CbiB [Dongia soli]|uniref:Cobalamin biosynthesis protein CobD n=1 Tax=Dongia soli TaxID=600628 RepID=A0ABU5EBW4_9PROT|nr:adenosylcobinamide-phosphate synthase CbiB [Dongia soli]MDY0883870.1 adenosylcobinamide-phosphate synthase CbiB [Dongia soli]